MKFSPEEKAEIAKRAAEHGVMATIRHYTKRFSDLKEHSVRTWRNAYTREIRKGAREGGDLTIKDLPEKKKGRPYLLGEELDKQVRAYVKSLRSHGAVVNTAIALS